MNALKLITQILVIVGALNWGLVGISAVYQLATIKAFTTQSK